MLRVYAQAQLEASYLRSYGPGLGVEVRRLGSTALEEESWLEGFSVWILGGTGFMTPLKRLYSHQLKKPPLKPLALTMEPQRTTLCSMAAGEVLAAWAAWLRD